MLACKMVGENKKNQEKIRKFCLEEAKLLKSASNLKPIGEPKQQKPNTKNPRTAKKVTN